MIPGYVNADVPNIDRDITMHLYNVLVKHPKYCVHSGQTGRLDFNWGVWRRRTYIKKEA